MILAGQLWLAWQQSLDDRTALEAKLSSTRFRNSEIPAQIEDDDYAPRSLARCLTELEREEDPERALGGIARAPVVRPTANYGVIYQRVAEEIGSHLAADDGTRARSALRALFAKVVVQEGSARGGRVRPMQLHGDLFRMLHFAETVDLNAQLARPFRGGLVMILLVAGTGFEPVTFRL